MASMAAARTQAKRVKATKKKVHGIWVTLFYSSLGSGYMNIENSDPQGKA